MLIRTILFDKPLIFFVLLRTFFLGIAFSVGFNLIIISDLIAVPGTIVKLFVHNWGYLLLSYGLLIYSIGFLLLLAKKPVQIGFQGMFWITVFHAAGSLLFLGNTGKVGLLIGGACYGLALILFYLWGVVIPYLTLNVPEQFLPPFVQEYIPGLKSYFRAKPSAPFILSFMGLLLICAFLLIFELEKAAEQVANVAYFSLLIGVGIEVYQFLKGDRKVGTQDNSGCD